jgi:transposase InsO family protein
MSLKIEFVERAEKGENISRLCREFGISRTTGHKWEKRFKERGYEGLEDESRRPKTTPLATAEDLVVAVLESRESHPRWGPLKLEVVLRRRFGDQTPSSRTIARILKRAGKVRARRRRQPMTLVDRAPHVDAKAPNDVWTVDFKGWWRTGNGERCEPLTVRDAFSRFVLATVICPPTINAVRRIFERLFRRHGIPNAIHCDNGVPFISVHARGGLSKLSAWWMSLGIQIVRSRPACPQDNGAHERLHVDVSADVQTAPAATTQAQQRAIDRWRQEFNHTRPHQALQGQTPAEVYKPAMKRRAKPRTPVYRPGCIVRVVYSDGHVGFRADRYYISEALVGHSVGLEPIDALHVRVWYHELDLGLLEVEPEFTTQTIQRWLPEPADQSRRSRGSAVAAK